MRPLFETVELCGMPLASISSGQLVDHLFGELSEGRGGWLITANLDFVRRHVRDPAARALYASARSARCGRHAAGLGELAARTPLPERVAGSALVVPVCGRAARDRRRVYLLGGDPAANAVAAQRLVADHPGLVIAGRCAPHVSVEPTRAELDPILEELRATQPAVVLVAFGSPNKSA